VANEHWFCIEKFQAIFLALLSRGSVSSESAKMCVGKEAEQLKQI
jgi:hypothetical protein